MRVILHNILSGFGFWVLAFFNFSGIFLPSMVVLDKFLFLTWGFYIAAHTNVCISI